eukprot:504553-Lingulodinium_polyedra.AAC.1
MAAVSSSRRLLSRFSALSKKARVVTNSSSVALGLPCACTSASTAFSFSASAAVTDAGAPAWAA